MARILLSFIKQLFKPDLWTLYIPNTTIPSSVFHTFTSNLSNSFDLVIYNAITDFIFSYEVTLWVNNSSYLTVQLHYLCHTSLTNYYSEHNLSCYACIGGIYFKTVYIDFKLVCFRNRPLPMVNFAGQQVGRHLFLVAICADSRKTDGGYFGSQELKENGRRWPIR